MRLHFLASLLFVHVVNTLPLKVEWREEQERAQDEQFATVQDMVGDATGDSLKIVGKRDSITPLMTDCQFSIMMQITAVAETSSTTGYGACDTLDDGQGISAGYIQFTSCHGSLQKVYKLYCDQKSNDLCTSDYDSAISAAQGYGNCGSSNSGKNQAPGLDGFCDAWKKQASDDSDDFAKAQFLVAKAGYFDTIVDSVSKYHVTTALGIAQMFDTAIQMGPGTVDTLADRTNQNVGNLEDGGVSEAEWIKQYVYERKLEQINWGGAYVGTTARLQPFEELVAANDLNFDHNDVTITLYGSSYTLVAKC
ncbi:hypothetical protein HDU77_000188 [Chytriomyces hyalinus]|nr:hypothetical protein HDU77_000188 [Chytriomyces hyalinus]